MPDTCHAARQMVREDFERFDHIYCMDQNNLVIFEGCSPCESLGGCRDVAAPSLTGDFEVTYRDVVAWCEAILKT